VIAIINPGTGPVDDATEALAVLAIKQFVLDARALRFKRAASFDGDGRFGFRVFKLDARGVERVYEVEMPGRPLDEVRFLGPPQNPWHFPRLYVNCSSWLWRYGVDMLLSAETDEETWEK